MTAAGRPKGSGSAEIAFTKGRRPRHSNGGSAARATLPLVTASLPAPEQPRWRDARAQPHTRAGLPDAAHAPRDDGPPHPPRSAWSQRSPRVGRPRCATGQAPHAPEHQHRPGHPATPSPAPADRGERLTRLLRGDLLFVGEGQRDRRDLRLRRAPMPRRDARPAARAHHPRPRSMSRCWVLKALQVVRGSAPASPRYAAWKSRLGVPGASDRPNSNKGAGACRS